MEVVRLAGRLYPPKTFLLFMPVRGWVDRRAVVRPEGLHQWKIPVIPSGIESAAFRRVAQYLNRLRAPRAQWMVLVGYFKVYSGFVLVRHDKQPVAAVTRSLSPCCSPRSQQHSLGSSVRRSLWYKRRISIWRRLICLEYCFVWRSLLPSTGTKLQRSAGWLHGNVKQNKNNPAKYIILLILFLTFP